MSDNDPELRELRQGFEHLMSRMQATDNSWLEIFNEAKQVTVHVIESLESGDNELALHAAKRLHSFLEGVEDDVSRRMAKYDDQQQQP